MDKEDTLNVGTLTDKDVKLITDFLERRDPEEFAHVFVLFRDRIGNEKAIETFLDLISDIAEFALPYFSEYAQIGKLALKARRAEEGL